MLDTTLNFDFGADTGLSLTKVSEAGGVSNYRLTDGTNKFTLVVKHIDAPRGSTGDYHQIRLDVEDHTDDQYSGAEGVWLNIKTYDKSQNASRMSSAISSLIQICQVTDFVGDVLNSES
jgi:hypothetical protein